MKWTNRGHEFDLFYENLSRKSSFYLFGAGHDGKAVYDIICRCYPIHIKGFIDNNPQKQGKLYLGLPVYAWENIDPKSENAGVVITINSALSKEIDALVKESGLEKNCDFFHYEQFLSVLAAYQYDKLFIPSISFLPTTHCNLRCRSCLNFTPYIKRFEERSWESVQNDIDLFFSSIDYIGLFHISGGEPLLCSYIGRLIQYITEHYQEKIYSLETVTNGTVLPGQEFLDALQNCDIKVTVDDYRDALPTYQEIFEKVVSILEHVGGKEKVIVKKYDSWIDLAPFSGGQEKLTPAALMKKFDACHAPWQEYRNGRFFLCNYASYAASASIISELGEEEYFDLSYYTQTHRKELMEFRLGYSEKGYCEFCQRCSGYLEINPNIVKPAVQME